MTYILNEHEWARDAIEERELGKKPIETLTRVARYYLDEGYKKAAVRKLIEEFLVKCRPDASPVLWMNALDSAVSRALNRNAINIGSIVITKPEMAVIDNIEGVQTRRLAFTLLCLAKYYDAINPEANHWVPADDRDIMALANIKTSIKRQSAMYRQLRDEGLLRFSKKVDSTSVCVLFIADGDPAMVVDDFRNLGNQYLLAKGTPGYFRCEICGAVDHVVKKASLETRGRKTRRCRKCRGLE